MEGGKPPMAPVEPKPSQFWWAGKTSSRRRSPWLITTLSELEEKTNGMLELVEEDADSFAKRAEIYYNKRPQLVKMIHDSYRAQRSLAEKYDQLRMEAALRRTTSLDSSFPHRSWSMRMMNELDKSSESSFDKSSRLSVDSFDSEESEVDDLELDSKSESSLREVPNTDNNWNMIKLLSEEMETLRKENAILKAELAVKDEAKREVIRQLSMYVDILAEENNTMRKCIKDSEKSGGFVELKKLKKRIFSGKLFSRHPKSQTTVVAV